MEKKLTISSMILGFLCIIVGGGVYYFNYAHSNLVGISCEANAKFTYVNNLENKYPSKEISIVLKMNYVFLPHDKGVLTQTGIASSGDETFFVFRNMNFSYIAQDDFYKFEYYGERRSPRDTLPQEVYSYFFNSESNFYRINYLDRDTLMFSNVYSPMFLCNINT